MSEHTKQETAVLFKSQIDGEFLTIAMSFIFVEDGKIRNGRSEPWDDLEIRCQTHYRRGEEYKPLYGWEYEYRSPYSVDLYRAEKMVKTLRKIRQGLRNLECKFGPAESFAAYATRILSIMGVKWIARTKQDTRVTFSYDDAQYVFFRPKELHYVIANAEHDAKTKWGLIPVDPHEGAVVPADGVSHDD